MLNRKHTMAAAIAAALLVPAVASAADPFVAVPGEAGLVFRFEPSRLTREEVLRALTYPDVAADGWRFVGGEAGWSAEGARLNYANGRLAHNPLCLFDPAKAQPAKDSGPIDRALYRGA